MNLTLPSGHVVTFDACDKSLVDQHSWFLSNGYARCEKPGAKGKGHARLYMHRLIIGATKLSQVDHINGDKLDNRRCNLRLVTAWQNAMNRSGSGVTWDKKAKLWAVQITHGYDHFTLGYFKSSEAATASYQTAIKLLRGPYARQLHLDQFKKAQ